MITEEALPTYMAMLNTLDGVRDETGASQTPWGRWTRQWVAEENRHGDLMNKYCWLRWALPLSSRALLRGWARAGLGCGRHAQVPLGPVGAAGRCTEVATAAAWMPLLVAAAARLPPAAAAGSPRPPRPTPPARPRPARPGAAGAWTCAAWRSRSRT